MKNHIEKTYHAAIYLRLSKEDGDISDAVKAESNSISSQRQLIKDFLKTKKEIKIVSERVDDGHTGSNFDRPAFQLMMKDIEQGLVNCVVVKDLSRFGREYIDAGKYLEKIFPALGVRFISINDNYDSADGNVQTDEIVLPLRNLMNDAYCWDISKKVRSNLESKRKESKFISAFAPYGYKKSESNRNQIEIDPYAAAVVEDIFKWKIAGMSQDAIADKLNQEGILSPLEYKNYLGYKFNSGYKTNEKAKWSAVTIKRILQNEVYIGNLVQGIRTTPNHKIKIVITKPEEEWVRITNAHEPIVSKETFKLVKKLLAMDTRTAPSQQGVYPLSGIAVCGDCGAPMARKVSSVGGKKYSYYVCSEHKQRHTCSSHRIPEKELETAVLTTLQQHVRIILDRDRCLQSVDHSVLKRIKVKKMMERISVKQAELQKYVDLKQSLYEDFKSGLLSEADYRDIKAGFEKQRMELEAILAEDTLKLEQIKAHDTYDGGFIQVFRQYRNITELSRTIVVELIDCIKVFEKKQIEIQFAYQQELDSYMKNSEEILASQNTRGAV